MILARTLSLLCLCAMLMIPSLSHSAPFLVTAASFQPAGGYGTEKRENSGTLLDVVFSTAGTFKAQIFNLNTVNDSFTFNFGKIDLQEENSNSGINPNEKDQLDVAAFISFSSPGAFTKSVSANGTATTGSVSDSDSDYRIDWQPVSFSFGNGGLFEVSFTDLTFYDRGAQIQRATVTLKAISADAVDADVADVPEPASFALVLTGLGCLCLARRTHGANVLARTHRRRAFRSGLRYLQVL